MGEEALGLCSIIYEASLVSIEMEEQWEFLAGQLEEQYQENNYLRYAWTGGTDHGSEGSWHWEGTGLPVPAWLWMEGEPDKEPESSFLHLYQVQLYVFNEKTSKQ